ncbi:glycosyltransferase family 4 protein [Thermogladius sp. KZ2Tp1]|uniref:glycosyltransferase family 4 protein n=1 Tax=Thermogladius sp. KZ2Tp1 TaxID=3136289 RepID=UPI003DA82404
MTKPKLLIIAPCFGIGGPSNALYFIKYLNDYTKTLFPANPILRASLINVEKALNTKIIVFNCKVNHYVMQALVRHVVDVYKPDYIISTAPELLCLQSRRLLERTLVIPQGFLEPIVIRFQPLDMKALATYPEIYLVSRSVGAYAAISKYMYKRIVDVFKPKRIALIYNPVMEQYFQLGEERIQRLSHPSKLRLLYVGRLERLKGVHKLIEWFPSVLRDFGDVSLHVVGSGSLLNYLRYMIRRQGLSNRIFIHGFVDGSRLLEIYQHSNILVTASYWESFCLPVAEAAASAMPSVVREAFALKEHIELGYAIGFSEDSEDAFVKAVGKVVDNYERLSHRAYSISRRLFHPSKVAERVNKILKSFS